MNKLKDILLLLFWGIVAGVFFVGCILGFMWMFNHMGEIFSFSSIQNPTGRSILECVALGLLAGVIGGALKLISWIWAKTHKNYWEAAQKIFPQEVLHKIHTTPLAKAVLDGNDWELVQLMGKKSNRWAVLSNEPVLGGMTPLHIAVAVENVSACKTLLQLKADPLRPDDNGLSPLNYAMQANRVTLIKLLEKYTKK